MTDEDEVEDVNDAEEYLERLREWECESTAWAKYEAYLDGAWPEEAYGGSIPELPRL